MAAQEERRADALRNIEALRVRMADPETEAQALSVNDWIERVRAGAQQAHVTARAGLVGEEYVVWCEMAAACLGRAEHLLKIWEDSK